MTYKWKQHPTPLRSAFEVQHSIQRNKPVGLAPAELHQPVEELLQELRLHQVELEMQNETLRLAQSALEDSRDRYIDLFELAPVGYLTLLSDGMIDEINLTGARLLGSARKYLLHRQFASLVIPEERDRWNRHFMRVKARGQQGTVELALKRDEGRVFFAQLDCLSIEGGRAAGSSDRHPNQRASLTAREGVRITLIDITVRKQAEMALFDSHETLCSILATTRDGYWHVDAKGRLIDVNAVYCQQSGYLRRELIGMRISDLDTLHSAAEVAERLRRIIKTCSVQFESRHRRKNGSIWHVEVSITYRENAGGEFFVFLRDISERKKAENALKESEAFKSVVLNSVAAEIVVLDRNGVIQAVNERWRRFSVDNGFEPGQAAPHTDVGTNYLSICEASTDSAASLAVAACGGIKAVLDGTLPSFQLEYPCHSPQQQRWFSMLVMPLGKNVIDGVVITHSDVTERKLMEEQVRHLAFYDPLTELPNRRLLSDRLNQAMAASARSGCYGALMFVDLDNFKPLNDAYGHEVGDLLLVEVADRIKRCVREMDTVARLGGDEFVVMMVELDADAAESILQAEIVAEKIRSVLAEAYLLVIRRAGGDESTVEHLCTASIGVTLFINHQANQEEIIKRADTAMYRAKGAGRNSIHCCSAY